MDEDNDEFNIDSIIERRNQVIGKNFLYKRISLPRNPLQNLFNGVIFYRPKYDFLTKPEEWKLINIDFSTIFNSELYLWQNKFFISREMYEFEFHEKEDGSQPGKHFKKLSQLSKMYFKKSKFEEVMGIFLCSDPRSYEVNFQPILYHTYCGGISFIQHFAKPMREILEKKLAEAIAEINKRGIDYVECQPTNIRYDPNDKKIIFNPHESIVFKDESKQEGQVDDVAVILYTHDWIKNPTAFINYYIKSKGTIGPVMLKSVVRELQEEIELLDMGDGLLNSTWHKKEKKQLKMLKKYLHIVTSN